MKSILTSRSALMLAASFPFTAVIADTPPAVLESVVSYPAPVISASDGVINKQLAESEAPRAVLSELSARPTRSQLDGVRIEGLMLISSAAATDLSGLDEEELAATLKAYGSRKNPDDATALETYISRNPSGSWTPGLQITCGTRLYHQGRFSEALDCFEKAWSALKDSKEPNEWGQSTRINTLCESESIKWGQA